MPIQLEIVTPEKKIFSDEVDGVVIPGVEGEMGVLPQHSPLVTALSPGELHYTQGTKQEELAVGQGFVEVTAEKVSVLTDMAVSDDPKFRNPSRNRLEFLVCPHAPEPSADADQNLRFSDLEREKSHRQRGARASRPGQRFQWNLRETEI